MPKFVLMKDDIRTSKFLSLVLRHQPKSIGIVLDENGWTDVGTLIEKTQKSGIPLDFERLKHIVDTNEKKRFAFNSDFTKIRASQGHSVEVDLGYTSQKPPAVLYHGTTDSALSSIMQTGIEKRKRHHVHLSKDQETAIKVGQRHGKAVILQVLAEKMFEEGFQFFLSENGVWLTDEVPVRFIKTS